LWSAHFAPHALLEIYRPDNAHNNFAQIAGELGIVGFIAFCVVLAAPFTMRAETPDRNPLRAPVIAGVGVYILTWLGGHPLLVPEAAYPFWITLGVATALIARDSIGNAATSLVAFTAAMVLASIPLRVSGKSSDLDFTRVSYGVSARQLMTSRARLFVPGANSRIDIPLRARSASEDAPVEIEVLVDGSAAEMIVLHDRNWRNTPVDLPRDPSRRFHQIDLLIRPHASDSVDPDRSRVEVGKWEIISKPNG
jgi:O-antigen ligase